MAVLPYIETHLADHCNLNCRGCGHFSPLSEPHLADPTSFGRDIARLSDVFEGIEAIHLLGGEPLLHPQVALFARYARGAFPRAGVRLVTNGLLLPRMTAGFWTSMSELGVRIDVTRYPVQLDEQAIRALAARHGVAVRFTEMRTRFFTVPLRASGDRDPARSFSACKRLFDCAMVRDGRLYGCPVAPLSGIFAEKFGWPPPPGPADSLDLDGPLDAETVLEFLSSPTPQCRFCDGAAVRWSDWGRSTKSSDEWT